MLSPQALIKGLVQRALPASPTLDGPNVDVAMRQSSYGELFTMPLIRKQHGLADEGSYYVAHNNQSALAPTYNTAFTATNPFFLIQNNSQIGQRLYLDYVALTAAVAMVSTTTQGYEALTVVIDNTLRYSSAGTALTISNANMLAPTGPPVTAYAGAVVATAASGAARTIVGQRNIRPALSATVPNVIGDTNIINFGSVEGAASTISITAGQSNVMPHAVPPVVIGPGHSALVYIYWPVLSAPSAGTFVPELGFWMR